MVAASQELAASKKDCQRFFGFGKKIPKDVKRHCGMCRQHGIVVETRGHLCQFKNCDCWKCKLVRQRRTIMSTQIRIRREQDKKFQRTTVPTEADVVPWTNANPEKEINMCYFCQKCKNHGVLMWKKDHKKHCEYANCRCEQCDLIDTRRALDRHIKSNKGTGDSGTSSSKVSSSSSPSDVESSFSTVPASVKSYQDRAVPSAVFPLPTLDVLPPLPLTPAFPGLLPTFRHLVPFSPLATMSPILPSPLFSPFNPFDLQLMLNLWQCQTQTY